MTESNQSTGGTYQCPYPGCDWEPSRDIDSDNGLSRSVAQREIQNHRSEHKEGNRMYIALRRVDGDYTITSDVYHKSPECHSLSKADTVGVITENKDELRACEICYDEW